MGHNGMGWSGIQRDGIHWDGMQWDPMRWDPLGWDAMGWDGMGWDPMGCSGMGRILTGTQWEGLAAPPLCPPAAHQVLSEAKAPCFRVLRDGRCALPTLRNITRQICCCSRVGKAWGRDCLRCPPYGSGQTPQQHSEPEGTP